MLQNTIELDKIDLKILHVLQENGRLSNVELSERVALPLGLQVMIPVSTNKSPEARQDFEQAVQSWNEVLGCFALTGDADYLLHAFFTDMQAFSNFVLNVLLSHTYVQDAKSSFVLKEIKNTTALPLAHLE